MTLSIIIPVYRVEATLDRCLQSIIGQTFRDFEAILVDDGSPDGCPQMCDQWARRDPRIRVIHKSNGGLSDARNAGLDAARGAFVTFVDSDDYVDTNTYRQLLPLMADCDMVEFPVYRHYGTPRQKHLSYGDSTFTDMRQYWLCQRAYEHTYAWNKIYRRELFSDVRFPVGRVFEDVATLPRLLQHCRRVKTTEKGLYYYCWNNKGITAQASGQELAMLLDAHADVIRRWCDDAYYMHVLNIQMDVCRLTDLPPCLPFRRVNPLTAGMPLSVRAKSLILNLIGIKGICRLNRLIYKVKKANRS